jgi:hypothetical protein
MQEVCGEMYDLKITHFAYKLHQSHPPRSSVFSLSILYLLKEMQN